MEPVQFEDNRGESLALLEDAGYYFSPNVQPDNILNLQNFRARTDDVLVVTYPKSGTHWVSEIVSMLIGQSEKLTEDAIKHIEFMPSTMLDELPSPRVLCSHLPYPRVPLDFLRKRVKIVLCVRNPRDVAVSYFKFISNLKVWNYSGSWDSFLPLFLNGNLPYNSWFEHTDMWLKMTRSGKHNVHLLFYEELQQDFQSTTSRLAKFLGVEPSPELLGHVQRETSFLNMKRNKLDITMELSRNGLSPIYRTGEVGGWMDWFTAEQTEQIDQEMEEWGLHLNPRIKYSINTDDLAG